MMDIVFAVMISAVIGYGLGCLHPSALIAKIKRKDLRESGTKNLGASNVTLTFGKALGVVVAIFDIGKSFVAFKLCEWLFSTLTFAGTIASVFAIIGHIFPFYLKFSGGKGFAAFAGLLLGINPWLFLFLLVVGGVLVVIVNQSYIMPYFSACFAPIWVAAHNDNVVILLFVIVASGLIMWKHFENLKKGLKNEDVDVRKFIRETFIKK